MPKQAVLLLAHGTPETADQIPEYLRNVVSGRPMPQHVVEEIQHRYALIGHSPLTELTLEQGRLVEAELAAAGQPVPVYVGMRNWRPYIPDVVRQMRADGVEEAAVICMAPQNSRTSVGLYRRAVQAEAGGLRIDFTAGWARHPLLAEAFAERLRACRSKLTAETGASSSGAVHGPQRAHAHGAAARMPEAADSRALGPARAPTPTRRRRATPPSWWPSACRRFRNGGLPSRARAPAADPWIGPTVERRSMQIAAEGVKAVILQPIGFLCDHVEILYDVDIAFRAICRQIGHAPGTAGVAERLADVGQGRRRSCQSRARAPAQLGKNSGGESGPAI